MRPLITLLMLLVPIGEPTWALVASDPDSDRDGLPDCQETHMYFTDPGRPDSDGDGAPDGNWQERREFTYHGAHRVAGAAAVRRSSHDRRLPGCPGWFGKPRTTWRPK